MVYKESGDRSLELYSAGACSGIGIFSQLRGAQASVGPGIWARQLMEPESALIHAIHGFE